MCSILGFCSTGGTLAEIERALAETKSRGPDATRILDAGNGWLGFNRLSIMGLTDAGMQPFVYQDQRTLPVSELCEGAEYIVVCNGEIYGFRIWKEELIHRGYSFISNSDCELLPGSLS